MSFRVLAVDWSGALSSAATKIWLAEASGGTLLRLECGRDRVALADYLIDESRRSAALVVGLDFAFSLPAWFLEERGMRSAPELWALASLEGEEWLSRCEPPFWGRPGKRRPAIREGLRRTDREAPRVGGIGPKSVFQVGGAGAVGTGSLRGMPILSRLRDAGFAIWPFDPLCVPLVIEIYPRLLTGAVNKGDPAARRAYLRARYPALSGDLLERAAASEDAFDAAVSALAMDAARDELRALPALTDRLARLEGQIWWPGMARSRSAADEAAAAGSTAADCHSSGPRSVEAWRSLVLSMLPAPVSKRGSDTLVGGDPGEVVVTVTPDSIEVARFDIRWEGQIPTPADRVVATLDPRRSDPRDVARAVIRARAARLGTYRWCTHCHSVTPPEWMHDARICQGCAQRDFHIVY